MAAALDRRSRDFIPWLCRRKRIQWRTSRPWFGATRVAGDSSFAPESLIIVAFMHARFTYISRKKTGEKKKQKDAEKKDPEEQEAEEWTAEDWENYLNS